jgi:hypothetical protein
MSRKTLIIVANILLIYSAIVMVFTSVNYINNGCASCSVWLFPWVFSVLFTFPLGFCVAADAIYGADIVEKRGRSR